MDPHDWNSYLAGQAAFEDMAREVLTEANAVLDDAIAQGRHELFWRWLAIKRITDTAEDPRP